MLVHELSKNEYDPYTSHYINLVPAGPLLELLENSKKEVLAFFQAIPEEKESYRYAPEKWSIKDVLQHMIDVERIMAYRCLRFSREDQSILPGFEVEDYASVANTEERSIIDLAEEYDLCRSATIKLFKNLSPDELAKMGMASGSIISVRAMGFKLIGHDLHHCQVIRARYLGE